MSFFLSSCFSSQTRTDLVLVKLHDNAAVRRFLKTFRKIAGKPLWWTPFLAKFKLFKTDPGKGVFLSVFQTPFYGCFQAFNRNAFLWMIILFGANTPASSKICEKWKIFLIKCPEMLRRGTFLFSHAKFTYFLKCIPFNKKNNLWDLIGLFVKLSPLRISESR